MSVSLLPRLIEFAIQTAILLALLWIMIKIQKFKELKYQIFILIKTLEKMNEHK